jgi:hypothetical protein
MNTQPNSQNTESGKESIGLSGSSFLAMPCDHPPRLGNPVAGDRCTDASTHENLSAEPLAERLLQEVLAWPGNGHPHLQADDITLIVIDIGRGH